MKQFEEVIKAYLEQRAKEDELFAVTFQKQNKSVEECCKYIIGEARKKATQQCCVMADEDVYNLAIHYYDEDSIVLDKPTPPVKTFVPPVKNNAVESVSEQKKPKRVQLEIPFVFD